jgi:hypothetical protein
MNVGIRELIYGIVNQKLFGLQYGARFIQNHVSQLDQSCVLVIIEYKEFAVKIGRQTGSFNIEYESGHDLLCIKCCTIQISIFLMKNKLVRPQKKIDENSEIFVDESSLIFPMETINNAQQNVRFEWKMKSPPTEKLSSSPANPHPKPPHNHHTKKLAHRTKTPHHNPPTQNPKNFLKIAQKPYKPLPQDAAKTSSPQEAPKRWKPIYDRAKLAPGEEDWLWECYENPSKYIPPPFCKSINVPIILPHNLMGYVIGRNGSVFKAITYQVDGLSYIWYDKEKRVIEIWGKTQTSRNKGAELINEHMLKIHQDKM